MLISGPAPPASAQWQTAGRTGTKFACSQNFKMRVLFWTMRPSQSRRQALDFFDGERLNSQHLD